MKKHLLIILISLISLPTFSQWTAQASGSTVAFPSIYFLTDNLGFCVGPSGTILKTIDGGTNWLTLSSGVSANLNEVEFIDSNTGYVVGNSGVILKTTNGGTTWTSLSSGTSTALTRICINGSDIYVAGYYGLLLKSSTAGASWTTLTTGTSYDLFDCFFTDANTGYIVGNGGTILKTTNAGTSWTPETSGTSTFQLFSVCFTDANNGYIAGGDVSSNSGMILKTTNAGTTWTSQTIINNFFGNIRFLNATTGFVAGGNVSTNISSILKTNNSGATWTVETSSSSRQFGLALPSFNAGYTCGLDGTILKTTGINAGTNEFQASNLNIVIAPNPSNGQFNFNNLEKENTIEIYDITGKLVYQTLTNSPSFNADLRALDKGVYMYKVTNDKKQFQQGKLILQ